VRHLRDAEKGKKHVVDEQEEEIVCIRHVSFGRIDAHKKRPHTMAEMQGSFANTVKGSYKNRASFANVSPHL